MFAIDEKGNILQVFGESSGGGGGATKEIGEQLTFSLPQTNANLHTADGALLTSTDAPKLFQAAETVIDSATTEANITKIGEPTISDDFIASGFTTNKYLLATKAFQPKSATWELVAKYKSTQAVSSSERTIIGDNATSRICLYISSDDKITVKLSSNNSSYDIGSIASTYIHSLDRWYWAKITFNGTQYEMLTSVDGMSWSSKGTINKSTTIYDTSDPLSIGVDIIGNTTKWALSNGAIDLAECYFKINGQIVWQGVKSSVDDFFTTEATWQAEVANTGACNKYVYDEANSTLRLPKLTNKDYIVINN